MIELFLSAGEVSGDKHAADLMTELEKLGDFRFIGLGGFRMREKGLVNILDEDFSVTSTVGFVESLHFLPSKLKALKLAEKTVLERKISWALLIDNQGFNIPLAEKLHDAGVGVIYYLPPRVSIWGKWNAPKVSKITDLLIPFLPKDGVLYQDSGANVFFAGLPLLDSIASVPNQEQARAKLGLSSDKPVISVFPGSRQQEIKRLTPVFAKAAAYLNEKHKCQILVPVSHSSYRKQIRRFFLKNMKADQIRFLENQSLLAMSAADVNLMASGTATLESALLRRPMVICYQISALSFWIGKFLVKSQMFGLPNLIAGEKVFPELIRGSFNVSEVIRSVESFLNVSEGERALLEKQYDKIRASLGNPPVVEKTARKILETLNGKITRN